MTLGTTPFLIPPIPVAVQAKQVLLMLLIFIGVSAKEKELIPL